jgi:predicted metal-dependent peptidase
MMGKLSANMQRFVDEVLQPKVAWQDVLRRFVQKAKTDQRTFARPNRRFLAQGLYMPSITGEVLGEIAIAVDCSGSIGQRELNEFATEIKAMKEDGNPSALHIVYFDSEVSHYDHYGRDDEVVIEPHGGGGTAFSPIFQYLEQNNINPVACVVLTDLYCNDFGDTPDYPVLWVTNGTDQAPWGEVVKM